MKSVIAKSTMGMHTALVAATAFALTACGGTAQTAADPTDTPASGEATVSSAATPAAGEKPGKDFLVGKWGTDGDCDLAIDLRADGTSDGPFGDWAYSDGVISFADAPDLLINVTVIDGQSMESTNGSSGKTTRMTRCP